MLHILRLPDVPVRGPQQRLVVLVHWFTFIYSTFSDMKLFKSSLNAVAFRDGLKRRLKPFKWLGKKVVKYNSFKNF